MLANVVSPWAARLQAAVASLGPLPPDQVRLYRIQCRENVAPAPWLGEALRAQGVLAARGRWFTAHPDTLAFYAEDTPDPELQVIVVPSALAEQWVVSALPAVLPDGTRPQRFSRAPDQECFIPVEWVRQAVKVTWPNPALTVRRRPARR